MNNSKCAISYTIAGMNPLRSLKIRHLEVFHEVARHRSVSRAAESLALTQPAVTRTLRDLEAAVGAALVERDGRGIRLTVEGEIFLRHAGASLAAVRGGVLALSGAAGEGPPVRIGAIPTVAGTVVPEAVGAFLELRPRTRVVVTGGNQDVLVDRLRRGSLDLVVGRLPSPEHMDGLVFEPLSRESVAFVLHHAHPLAADLPRAVEGMARFPVLIPPKDSLIRPLVDRLFVEQGLPEPPLAVETVADAFGRAFVRRHRAVWIISRSVVADELASGEFLALPVDTRSTLGAIGLTARAEGSPGPAVELLMELLRGAAARHGHGVVQGRAAS
jgi:LysR family pca operon transcriptional activator